MQLRSVTRLLIALLIISFWGCDTGTTPSSEEIQSPEPTPAEGSAKASDEATADSKGSKAKDQSEADSKYPEGEAPDRAPLEARLAEMEAEAEETLFEGDSCSGFADLEKCRRDEKDEEWRTAAECYRNFVVVGGPAECRAAQFVKAAANFERAGSRQGAIATRMQVVKIGQEFTAAAVDAADYMIEHDQIERARVFYDSYRRAHPDGELVEYVDKQCGRIGGCSDQEYPPKP